MPATAWVNKALELGAVHVLGDSVEEDTWLDEHPSERHATIVGATLVTESPPGNFSKFFSFNGVDQHGSLPVADFGATIRNCAIEMVMRYNGPTTGAASRFCGCELSGTSPRLYVAADGPAHVLMGRGAGPPQTYVQDADGLALLASLGWFHVVWSITDLVNPVSMVCRINGEVVGTEVSTSATNTTFNNFSGNWFIGANNNGAGVAVNFTEMDLAVHALYPGPLSEANAGELYTAAMVVPPSAGGRNNLSLLGVG